MSDYPKITELTNEFGSMMEFLSQPAPADFSYLQNYVRYMQQIRGAFGNWMQVFTTPAIVAKVKKNPVNLFPTLEAENPIDRHADAFGKSNLLLDPAKNQLAFDYFNVYLPLNNDSFNKINTGFSEQMNISAALDDRFVYKQGDLIFFKFDNYLYQYVIENEPQKYLDILYELVIKYVTKNEVTDKNLPKVIKNQERHW